MFDQEIRFKMENRCKGFDLDFFCGQLPLNVGVEFASCAFIKIGNEKLVTTHPEC